MALAIICGKEDIIIIIINNITFYVVINKGIAFKKNVYKFIHAIAFVSVVGNICEASICFMQQQPDPNHHFVMRWVLPFVKDTRCFCNEIQLHHASKCTGRYHIAMPKARDYFYTDDPLLFLNNDSQESLQILLECKKGKSRFKGTSNDFVFQMLISLHI